MGDFSMSFWKIFAVFGFLGTWAEESLKPDEDGKVRITIAEAAKFFEGLCAIFGWTAEIVMPEDTDTQLEDPA